MASLPQLYDGSGLAARRSRSVSLMFMDGVPEALSRKETALIGRQVEHDHRHAFSSLNPRVREGLVVSSRRSMLKASLMGLSGLSLPGLLRGRARAVEAGRPVKGRKAVILLWMAGGPSHIDTWDPKPGRPLQNRGPFGVIPTRLPGVHLCEHLPKQAAMLDRFTIIRSVDARFSNHEPNQVL